METNKMTAHKKKTQTTLLIMCNANETRQGERKTERERSINGSHIKWVSTVRSLPIGTAIGACLCQLRLHHTATGSTKGNNELRANNAHKVDPNGNSCYCCCCCCAILIPWLPFDSASNNNKREPPPPLSRVATRSLSLSLTAVKLHTQSLRVSSNVRFGLVRTLPVEK